MDFNENIQALLSGVANIENAVTEVLRDNENGKREIPLTENQIDRYVSVKCKCWLISVVLKEIKFLLDHNDKDIQGDINDDSRASITR